MMERSTDKAQDKSRKNNVRFGDRGDDAKQHSCLSQRRALKYNKNDQKNEKYKRQWARLCPRQRAHQRRPIPHDRAQD